MEMEPASPFGSSDQLQGHEVSSVTNDIDRVQYWRVPCFALTTSIVDRVMSIIATPNRSFYLFFSNYLTEFP